MAKRAGQKAKLLHILEYLEKYTDEDHAISTQEIIDKLENDYGIICDRKTIYADINCLKEADFDITAEPTRNGGGWKLLGRDFQLPELKLLVDAIQSSKFITAKKSKELIRKLENLVSIHEGKQLQRQVVVTGRNKAENENIFYNIDYIYKAFRENKQISIKYLEWNIKKELVQRGEDKRIINPWALIWNDENYYLIAYDEIVKTARHFRVDKMTDVKVLDTPRQGGDWYNTIDIGQYAESTFGMMGGAASDVTIELPEKYIGVIIDRFGKDISVNKVKDGFIKVRLHNIRMSNHLFGWLAGISTDAVIVSPKSVRDEYVTWAENIIKANKIEG